MNNGDLAVEKNDMGTAMNEYNAAMKLFPQNLEMQYWTAITLANNKQVAKALPVLKTVFSKDDNWKELTRRLPKVNLLTVNEAELKMILSL
jgi:predicted Zn-dependent protease